MDRRSSKLTPQQEAILDSANSKVAEVLLDNSWTPDESDPEIQRRSVSFVIIEGQHAGRELQARQYRSGNKQPFRNVVQVIRRSGLIEVNSGWHPRGYGDLHNISDADAVLSEVLGEGQ